jgi:rhodanese-related sulfurtransferase
MKNRVISLLVALGLVASFATAAEVPTKKKKITPQALYVTAVEAHDMVKADGAKVLFVDTRTPEEVYFVGMPEGLDKNIPVAYVNYGKIKEKKGKAKFASSMNKKFVEQIDAALKEKGLTKEDKIILICRSGGRSATAAKKLDKAGYKKVYTVVDGFEGDKSKDKKLRTVNGWKNAGLPYSYKFNKNVYILER